MARALQRVGRRGQEATVGRGVLHGSVRQAVTDGDTIAVDVDGHVGVRFFSIDAPETKFFLPRRNVNPQDTSADVLSNFVALNSFNHADEWDDFLGNAFDNAFGQFPGPPGEQDQDALTALGQPLIDHLTPKLDANCRKRHFEHAEAAHHELEALLDRDRRLRADANEEFKLFMRFAYEVVDRYGRLLCYLHLQQTEAHLVTERRQPSYNVQLLELGVAIPYFIWPNLDPQHSQAPLAQALPAGPNDVQDWVNRLPRLRDARVAAVQARSAGRGVWSEMLGPGSPRLLLPYELRYLAGRRTPTRRVLDLSTNNNVLLKGNRYFDIPNLEDRLFIDDHFVPLWQNHGFFAPP